MFFQRKDTNIPTAELHDYQGEAGRSLGMPVKEFVDQSFEGFVSGSDQIIIGSVGPADIFNGIIDNRRTACENLAALMRGGKVPEQKWIGNGIISFSLTLLLVPTKNSSETSLLPCLCVMGHACIYCSSPDHVVEWNFLKAASFLGFAQSSLST